MKGAPIIESMDDVDEYKLAMGKFIRHYYPREKATYSFINRSKNIRLADSVDLGELRENLDHVSILANQAGIGLSPYSAYTRDGQLEITCEGMWDQASLWETYVLSIVSELYHRKLSGSGSALERLNHKVAVLQAFPDINISDFGTRRRFSRRWHSDVVEILSSKGLLKSTSNVALGKKFSIPARGTMGHEIFMGVAGLYDHSGSSLKGSQQIVLGQWWDMFGESRAIALTDTWNSGFFFNDFTLQQYQTWKGYRHDSGHTDNWMNQLFYNLSKNQMNNTRPTVVFSNGLNLMDILILYHKHHQRANLVFGWGTNLVNDTGISGAAPQIVMKLTKINDTPTVKLSDDSGKYLGTPEKLKQYGKTFGWATN